jgi:hypothetical protein
MSKAIQRDRKARAPNPYPPVFCGCGAEITWDRTARLYPAVYYNGSWICSTCEGGV